MSKKVYIIAVSGGVDSVVLLHKLMSVKPPSISYVIAHFDHGIRDDSKDDVEFVKCLAEKYDVTFVSERAELGDDVSEDQARIKRYEFLRKVKDTHKAEAIITAHHQDDILETMVVNIVRGTGPRGLIGYTATDIIRPFMNKTRADVLNYAQQHGIKWREDSTNANQAYLRNYIRKSVISKISTTKKNQLLHIREGLEEKYIEIDSLTKKLLVRVSKKSEIYRPLFVVLPYKVQREVIASALRLKGVEIDRKMVEKAVVTVKTLHVGKQVELKKNVTLCSHKESVLLKITP